jgi:nucleotide-binding universal stress UspA family protein
MSSNPYNFRNAVFDFQAARKRASIEEILARLQGRSNKLLSYDEVAEKLKLHARTERGTRNIPLDAIVGSVGRYTDFTRTFLPRRANDRERWAGVKAAIDGELGLPPIDVYKVGEAYFVIDGNHRVSVARQQGAKTIEARIIEVQTNVPLTPNVQPDDLIIKAEYANFLEATRLMDLRPNVDLSVTIPGQYEKLIKQIDAQKYLLEQDSGSNISFQAAVLDWYDTIYIPLAETIRDMGLLRWFPDRTITDLYIWIAENRSALEKELGWEIQSDVAATGLILEGAAPSGPGTWRKARTSTRYIEHLFNDILVPLSGGEESWDSLDQAILLAQRESARLHGLHVVDSKEKVESPNALVVQEQFEKKCADANVAGKLVIEAGEITRKIRERAAMTDVVVLKIEHPPMGGLSNLTSPFRTILMNSSSPLLGVPEKATRFQRALLAYDGSPHAKEALFVATYFAEMWKTELVVFSAPDASRVPADVQDHVRRYLDIHEVQAEYLIREGNVTDQLKNAVQERNIDLLLMGRHSDSMIRQVFVGSALDAMLRESRIPIFICH